MDVTICIPEKISAPLPKGSGAQKGFRELLQLGEVLDGADHLAHVAVLVVKNIEPSECLKMLCFQVLSDFP
jgi:hypothetical protein